MGLCCMLEVSRGEAVHSISKKLYDFVRIKIKNDGSKLGHYYKKYVWALVNKVEDIIYFFYDNEEDDSCGSRPIETFLGSIQSDGYVVYKHLDRILTSIYARAMKLLNSKRKHYGEMMRKSLSYMINGWEDLQNYRKDGRYTIDNMLVERAIRPFTIHRKNSLFFSSEEGVETVLTFLTLIETCKNVGLNARDYIATTIRLLMEGNENYDDLVPVSMAV